MLAALQVLPKYYFSQVNASLSQYRFRRANIDDVERLRDLWLRHGYDSEGLESRITEFQVALDESDTIVASIGIRNQQRQALFHHECWGAEMTHQVRRDLAAHAIQVAERFQVWRIWTTMEDVLWSEMGFDPVKPDALEDLPQGFGDWRSGWKAYKLRSDIASDENLARQFELLKIQNQEDNHKIKQTARVVGVVGYIIIFGIVCAIISGVVLYFRHSQ